MPALNVLGGCATIQLSRGKNALIDAEFYRELSASRWHAIRPGPFYAGRSGSRRRGVREPYVFLHRLVAEKVHGPCPDGLECRHVNGDSLDDRSSNLAWGTRRENIQDKTLHGTGNRGERCGSSKLTTQDVRNIRRMVESGHSQYSIAHALGVHQSTISNILTGKIWAWLKDE